jgi:hypothetical protein
MPARRRARHRLGLSQCARPGRRAQSRSREIPPGRRKPRGGAEDRDRSVSGHSRYRFYLAQSYRDAGNRDKALENYVPRGPPPFSAMSDVVNDSFIPKLYPQQQDSECRMADRLLLQLVTSPIFLVVSSFSLFAIIDKRAKGSATEERADGARAFEAPHIAIADELGAAFLCAERAARRSRAISRSLARRHEGRQQGDLRRRIESVRSRRFPCCVTKRVRVDRSGDKQQAADVRPHAVCQKPPTAAATTARA